MPILPRRDHGELARPRLRRRSFTDASCALPGVGLERLRPFEGCASCTSLTPTCRAAMASSPRCGRWSQPSAPDGHEPLTVVPRHPGPAGRAGPAAAAGAAVRGGRPAGLAVAAAGRRRLRHAGRHRGAHGADIVHVHTPGPVGLLGVLAAQRLGLPLVQTYHTDLHAYADAYRFPARALRAGVRLYAHRLAVRDRRCGAAGPGRLDPDRAGLDGAVMAAPGLAARAHEGSARPPRLTARGDGRLQRRCCSARPTRWWCRPGRCSTGSRCRCRTSGSSLVPTGVAAEPTTPQRPWPSVPATACRIQT